MMKKPIKLTLTTILVFALLITSVPILLTQSRVSAAVNNSTFSIMQIGDTQFLSLSFPQLFMDTTNWIVNNAANYNLKMVIHTGDIVDNINATSGAYSDPIQWDNANAAMSQLLNAGIPYCWDAGNHDQIPWNDATGTWLGSSYPSLNASNMQSKPYWVSDFVGSKNTAVKFTYNSYQFMIVNLEYMASNTTIDWMKTLLDNNKGTNIIIAAHTYLNKGGTYGFSSAGLPGEVAWCKNFKTILDGYPNVFLTLSGHDPTGTANRTRVGNREEIFFNRQSATTTAGQTGAAAVRIYTFNMTTMQVNATTYSLDTQSWLTTATNQFSFNIALKSELTVASVSKSSDMVTSGFPASFNATVSGGTPPYSYQWYIETSQTTTTIGTNSNRLDYSSYTPNNYNFYCKITDSEGTTINTTKMNLIVVPIPTPTSITTPTPKPTFTPTPTVTPTIKPISTSTLQPTSKPSLTPAPTTLDLNFTIMLTYATAIIIAILVTVATATTIVSRKRTKETKEPAKTT